MRLRQTKNELDRKVQDQEEELDEQAGTIQQLEQVRFLLFKMSLCQTVPEDPSKQVALLFLKQESL